MSVTIHRIHHPDAGLLGRLYVPDAEDAAHPLAMLMGIAPPRTVPWNLGAVLDQGQTPRCVAFCTRAKLDAEPVNDPDAANPTPDQIYAGAQANDGIFGPHDGSNDRGAMKYLQSIGMVDSYNWAQSLDEAIQFVTTTGPLECGTNWTQGMFTPDPSGFIQPLGPVEGGHEYLMYWYDAGEDACWFRNSWGQGWGLGGNFKMKKNDWATLFTNGGDACAAQIHFPRPVLPALP